MKRLLPLIAFGACVTSGCGPSPEALQRQALLDVKVYVQHNLDELHAAAVALAAAAPAPDADGWNAADDEAAVETMKAEWRRARVSYEHIEGAIAVLFPDLDVATDERYDGFLALGADANLFDGEGVTGIHALERILWSDRIPPSVVAFEEKLPGYAAAAFPASEAEARDFREKLAARLVTDVGAMRDQFGPLALDAPAAFRGVIGSLEEQLEKTTLAASGEEESRYAQHTLADMRANVEGGAAIFDAFRPGLAAEGGAALEETISRGLVQLRAAYDAQPGDALPPPPATWSSLHPTAEDLATPFGQLFALLTEQTDPENHQGTVHAMREAAELLGIPQLAE